jgi:beta-galactosidase GanA
LHLDYEHTGLARVLIDGGGRRPLLLLLGTPETTASFWRAGPVLVRGTSLLRSAEGTGRTAVLRADTAAAGPVEVFTSAREVTVNGRPVDTRRTPSGSLLGSLPGPRAVTLPALTGWRQHAEAPEAAPGFDDSGWTTADKTTSLSPFQPLTQPVLFSDEYHFHTGSVWYRGHFTATGTETTVALNAITGRRGNYLVWLDGHYLGVAAGGVEADSDAPRNPSPGRGEFAVPAGLLTAGKPATLAVLVQNMGHNEDWTVDDNRFRQPRGLVGASIGTDAAISWRIQGTPRLDPVRGPLNNGGLYGERSGWTLPGHPDRDWPAATPATAPAAGPGVTWLRTGFDLDLPKGQDTSLALRFDGPPPAGARALLYLNGWQIGQYGAAIGPQTDFVMPAGLLRSHGANTLAVAVIAEERATVGMPHLVVLGAQRGGVPMP